MMGDLTSPLRVVRTLTEAPRGPYDLALLVPREPRALRGGPDGIAVRWMGAPGSVRIDVLAAGEAPAEDVEWAVAAARGIAGLDDDPGDFREIARRHPLIERLARTYAGARLTRSATVWETFAKSVIRQLVTFEEARASIAQIWRRWGDPIPGTSLRAPPTAQVIAHVAPWDLRACGVGMRRVTTLLEGARRAKRLEEMRDLPPEEAIRRLCTLRGIGVWTANSIAIGAFAYADGCLVGDAVAPFVITMALTGKAGKDDAMLACLEPFRPHRARVHRLFELAQMIGGGVPGVPPLRRPPRSLHRRVPGRF